uniref:AlNc14C66G4682 protein n=1 Tax=Albugo laibachii Nc14 TaxID=890382 RepID=F0WDG2_9STRA|nr:AlNc14C66G4682 [Albugo laibachii Nc14]|eukprot:CCA19234.1 AlNc14C66G4682 [Albugo laibachii Nc14]
MIDKLDFEGRLHALRTSGQTPHSKCEIKSEENNQNDHSSSTLARSLPSKDELSPALRRQLFQIHSESMSYLDTSLEEFGVLYTKAIQLAQKAVTEERQRHVREAIRNYVQAGEYLTEIGRKQSNHRVQYTLKKRAFALLRRAEALAEWIEERNEQETSYPAEVTKNDAIAVQEEHLGEKRFALTTLRAQNERMEERVDKLAGILQARRRFRKLVGSHRAQKWPGNERHKATFETQNQEEGVNVDGNESNAEKSHKAKMPKDDTKKLVLVNELHAYLGLPELDQFTDFKPLSTDELQDSKLRQLEVELEESRRESIRLRQILAEKEKLIAQAFLKETSDTATKSNSVNDSMSDASTTKSPSMSPANSLPDDFEDRDMMLELQNILRMIQKDETALEWDDQRSNNEEEIDDGVWL